MLEKITPEELEFMETFCDPIAMAECLFSNLDNLVFCDAEEFSEIRLGQFPMLSYEYYLDTNPQLTDKENFKQREGAGSVYCFGGRKFGKTLCTEEIDLLENMIHSAGEECGFASFDALHIRGILEKIIQVLENHPFFKLFEAKINRSPTYRFFLKNGFTLDGVNMNLTGDNPGGQFFQKHFKRLYIEEASFETDEVFKKRSESISEDGCVFRVSGMTNFTKYSPPGRIFYDIDNKNRLINLPQFINPKWDEKTKEKSLKDHAGEESISYRVFVRGEVVEDGISAIDMERVRKNYNYKKLIKNFEVTKDNYPNFSNVLIVERPENVETLYISADIGESAPTEIMIITELNKKFKYIYNITLYNLTDKEQFQIFKFLGEKLKANFIGLDCTDGTGRAIFHSLEEVFPRENLCWVAFNEKIKVDMERDDNNNIIFDEGQPVYREEYVEIWSVKRLRDLLYEEGKFELPLDYKLDVQLNSMISTQSGNRTLYHCVSPEDHLIAAFRVFSISQWINEFVNVKPIQKKTFSKTGY